MPFDEGDGAGGGIDSKVAVLLIGVGSAAVVVSIYHCFAMGWCNRVRAGPREEHLQRYMSDAMGLSVENSTAQLIPSFKYQKGASLAVGEEGTCAICLGEFEEGEELRTLPVCMHTYHAPCIDMWLCSHTNCPTCRADATPSPQVVLRTPSILELQGPDVEQSPRVLQDVIHRTS